MRIFRLANLFPEIYDPECVVRWCRKADDYSNLQKAGEMPMPKSKDPKIHKIPFVIRKSLLRHLRDRYPDKLFTATAPRSAICHTVYVMRTLNSLMQFEYKEFQKAAFNLQPYCLYVWKVTVGLYNFNQVSLNALKTFPDLPAFVTVTITKQRALNGRHDTKRILEHNRELDFNYKIPFPDCCDLDKLAQHVPDRLMADSL